MNRRLHLLDRPIFIVGAQRSGTTLLRLMLDAHPDVAIGPETAFARGVDAVVESPFFGHGDQWYQDYGWSRDRLERATATLYAEVFSTWARSVGAVRWGEKTPVHRYHVPRLARWFPDAQFIGLVRHPGAVASSRERWGYDWEASLRDWVASGRYLLEATEQLTDDRVLLLRYEDLVGDPAAAMRRLLGFLDLPWSPHVLEHHRAPRAEDAEERTLGGTDTSAGIDPAKAHRWADRASDEQRDLLAGRAGALDAWGYRLEPPYHLPADEATHAELLTRSPSTRAAPAPPPYEADGADGGDVRQLAAELEDSRRAREALIARIDAMRPTDEEAKVRRLQARLDQQHRQLQEARADLRRFQQRRSVQAAVRLARLFGR